MRRTIALLTLIMLLMPSLLILPLCSATPETYVPEFTINLIDSSYDTPSTSSVNGFTGEITTTEGTHVEMRTVTFKIKNEDFTTYTTQDGSDTWTINYFYNVRFKGPYETDWRTLFNPYDGFLSMDSDADYTILSYNCGYSPTDGLNFNGVTIPVGATVEFQVEALIGYIHHIYTAPGDPWGKYVFEGQTSGWSSTQTLKIGASTQTVAPSGSQSSTSPSVNPTGSQVFGLDWVGVAVVVLLAVIVVLLLFVVFYLRRRSVGGSVK